MTNPAFAYTDPHAYPSYFDGGLLQLIGWRILGFLITILTLGIAFPWAFCMIYSWEASHTVINGRRLRFNGTGGQLFGNWIKWLLLTIITLGIYSFWVEIKIRQWKVKHTHFA
ncbi:YjgN family protein [Gleimia sp. 6138-11-ORH1]|uniref:YjgN family protein n=1 Tax=Gleimia sp. 6138-11-ORH1 TaxID=2973937 RepID=UPI00216A04E1|nr:YjgN family protein [Gleimia sp. 6138-11-ORH1]MCS4484987.1 YjgN family protein [Gleimia sp. 6138-11-ORH1]